MPMPQTTPPISWLCDAFGLMILPQAVTSMARVTRTCPRSGSTFTSTNCAPCASVAYFCRSGEGFDSNVSVISVEVVAPHDFGDADEPRRVALEPQPCRRASPRRRPARPSAASSRPVRERRAASRATARAAPWTAEPTLAVVHEPPCDGARGKLRVAELELHLLGPQPEVLGGDHGHHRVGAGADVARRAGDVRRAVGA